jgi:hypothetical protein
MSIALRSGSEVRISSLWMKKVARETDHFVDTNDLLGIAFGLEFLDRHSSPLLAIFLRRVCA